MSCSSCGAQLNPGALFCDACGADASPAFGSGVAGAITIGREADNKIVIDAEQVSRYHARITVNDGELIIEDLGSSNGVTVNEVRVLRAYFTLTDVVQFGSYVFDTQQLAPFLG